MRETRDIVVIGGGIAGLSAAAALSDQASVTVLEQEKQLAYHSTGRSAAVFILNYGNAMLRTLNAMSLPALNGGVSGESVLAPRGEMLVAGEAELPALEAYLDGSDGLVRLSVDEAVERVPALRRDRIVAACYEEQALEIDVDRLVQGYVRKLKLTGGEIRTDARVKSLEQHGVDWIVRTQNVDINAKLVVNAAGAWADDIAKRAGLPPIGVQPMRRSAVIMPVDARQFSYRDWPLIASAAEDWYAKPEATGLMISPADEDPIDAQDAWPDDMVIAEGLHRFGEMMDIPITRPTHSWAGLRSFVSDRTPVCGLDPLAKGFFWLAGQGGYGVQTAPALADVTCAVCTGSAHDLPRDLLASLSPDRFR
ncbi:NAD(P)/FAD-dependent oxidoreductase [Marivita geojedonensis]|uniref:Glycerol-3-phosphate dehydrogenase n=1 Tax=Marivita geojedonensis TaxID=1123756 RepID=A0A1X4NKU0_9RHOB|nr:FAD-dependent oxidoreductase [Marivita geojedonensis]OSQ50864.1 glycerol-3-phosphate dehydrogenase [Marivita geojedonensis]PRY77446.1 D-arginine dehydrogenase [Marivita geojedonensis]